MLTPPLLRLAHVLPLFGRLFITRSCEGYEPVRISRYQAFADLMLPMRHSAALVNHSLDAWPFLGDTPQGRSLRATCDLITLAALTHSRRPFAIDSVEMEGKSVPVTEEITLAHAVLFAAAFSQGRRP